MIKIERRIIEVDNEQFINQLKELALTYSKTNYVGFDYKIINAEFKIKLTVADWLNLCKELNLNLSGKSGLILWFSTLALK